MRHITTRDGGVRWARAWHITPGWQTMQRGCVPTSVTVATLPHPQLPVCPCHQMPEMLPDPPAELLQHSVKRHIFRTDDFTLCLNRRFPVCYGHALPLVKMAAGVGVHSARLMSARFMQWEQEQIKTSLEILTKSKSAVEKVEQQQKQKISGVREQSQNQLTYITSIFAELRQMLNEKERLFHKELREEEESVLNPMENNLRAIQEKLNSIQEKLLKLQKRMNQTDSLIFLKEETRQKRRVSDEERTLSVADGALAIGKFDHPFLLNTVFSEVPDGIKRVSVTLDVETASPWLEVSEDRKRVRWTWTRRSLPDTGKRFTGSPCVLGSEGFTSGRHYWEVEVAGSRRWSLGVAAESVERKRLVRLTPETGVWSIGRGGDGFVALTSPPSPLPARPITGKLGVYLSYESGTVSFYDADTRSHLHTFTGNKFTEKLYPFFWTWDENRWLRICSGSAPGV